MLPRWIWYRRSVGMQRRRRCALMRNGLVVPRQWAALQATGCRLPTVVLELELANADMIKRAAGAHVPAADVPVS